MSNFVCPVENYQPGSKEQKFVILFSIFCFFFSFFFHKIKAKKRTISHYKKSSNKLHSILCNFWVVRFSNPFIWSQLFCLFVFKYCCFRRAICIKGMKKCFFAWFQDLLVLNTFITKSLALCHQLNIT